MDIGDHAKSTNLEKGPILHVVVVGFHHKKGCQVEYAYPPFNDGDPVESTECPDEWKHLPTLALPDGAHNFEKDTIYFHLPSRSDSSKTIFGISCYRQINAENLLNKSADITRGTVQKSVCILSILPLYGLINAKLELITHAYFDERDFSKVTLLQETFKSLNSSLKNNLAQGPQVFIGLSARDLVLQFRHKIVLLIKIILLEKRVLFLKAPVKNLCSCILSLLSLFPGMLENGLSNCMELTDIKGNLDVDAPVEGFVKDACNSERGNDNEIKNALDASMPENSLKDNVGDAIELSSCNRTRILTQQAKDDSQSVNNGSEAESTLRSYDDINSNMDGQSQQIIRPKHSELEDLLDTEAKEKVDLTKSKLEFQDKDSDAMDGDLSEREPNSLRSSKASVECLESSGNGEGLSRVVSLKGRMMGAFNYWTGKDKTDENLETNPNINSEEYTLESGAENLQLDIEDNTSIKEMEERPPPLAEVINLDINKCGLPLHIFEEGVLCHPYLSLPFLDLLKDPGVRGFLAGATNVLFKQKRHLVDAIVEIDDSKIEIWDNDLRKQLHLTTEDLRFADYLVKNVSEDQQDVFLDGTGWEGGDEWVRGQFKLYILCLLRTSMLQEGSREIEPFNPLFMSAWQKTHNYEAWKSADHLSVLEINPGHPFQGQLSMADMKLRISHTMQNSERGRKLNQAVLNTGKAVVQTSRALGGALTQAKSTVSSWLQMFNAPSVQSQPAE